MELINKPMKGLLYIATFVMLFSCNKNETSRPVDLVYPQMGSAWSRWFYFSSACRPFGMVSLFPDTKIDGEWKSGYRYGVDTIRDFSHIHEWQFSGVAVMPVTFTDENRDSIFADWSSVFSHQTETVKPGYHSVLLERYQIKAELTATNRVGAHRYKFPENTKNGVVFQLSKQLGPAELIEGGFKQTTENEITGFMVNSPTMRRPKPTTVYFCARFSQPIKLIHLSTAHGISPTTEWKGENGNILVEFNENLDEPLLMKVAVSFTDEAGAAKNLETEMPGWDFNQVAQEADNHWNDMLSRIEIEGGTEQQQRRFYSDLYHAIMGRTVDVEYFVAVGLSGSCPGILQLFSGILQKRGAHSARPIGRQLYVRDDRGFKHPILCKHLAKRNPWVRYKPGLCRIEEKPPARRDDE